MKEILKYIEDNPIKTYLNYKEDFNKLKEYIKDTKEDICIEDYISSIIEQYNYECALENEDIKYMLYLIYGCEFDVEIDTNGKLNLIDLQGAYLGGCDTYENFETIEDVLSRLSGNYLYDYFGIEGV